MDFKYIESVEDARKVFPILKELRTHLDEGEYLKGLAAARAGSDYKFVGAFEGAECLGLMGYRILHDFVHGRHLYVDDLVVTGNKRSKGLGSKFLTFAKEIAAKENCKRLRLCTGADNNEGRKFYEKNGWEMKAVVYKSIIS